MRVERELMDKPLRSWHITPFSLVPRLHSCYIPPTARTLPPKDLPPLHTHTHNLMFSHHILQPCAHYRPRSWAVQFIHRLWTQSAQTRIWCLMGYFGTALLHQPFTNYRPDTGNEYKSAAAQDDATIASSFRCYDVALPSQGRSHRQCTSSCSKTRAHNIGQHF